MKVILTKNVPNLGRSGEIKEVADGHARNYLIPKHLVLPATAQALAKIQKEQLEQQARIKRETEKSKALKDELEKRIFTITAKADKERLFAAVHKQEIAEAINKKTKAGVSPDQVVIEDPIKNLGAGLVELNLGHGISATIKINVESL